MTIKIYPKKIVDIKYHKTRKTITESTYASKKLIYKAFNISKKVELANKTLQKTNIPYLEDTQIAFYSSTKIILHSDKEILKSKIKELHDQFIAQLRQHKIFNKLKKIEIIIDNNIQTNNQKLIKNKTAKKYIEKIKEELDLKN
ncbi:MAG: hypothetical protein Kow0076_6250 [Francisella sp.]